MNRTAPPAIKLVVAGGLLCLAILVGSIITFIVFDFAIMQHTRDATHTNVHHTKLGNVAGYLTDGQEYIHSLVGFIAGAAFLGILGFVKAFDRLKTREEEGNSTEGNSA